MGDATFIIQLPDGTYTIRNITEAGLNSSIGHFYTREDAEASLGNVVDAAAPATSPVTTVIKPGDGPGLG